MSSTSNVVNSIKSKFFSAARSQLGGGGDDITATSRGVSEALSGLARNSKQQTHFPKSSFCPCTQSSHPSIPHPEPAEKPASSMWNPTEQGAELFTACYFCFLSQSPFCKDFIGLSSQWQPVGTRTKAAVTVEGNGHTADSLGMTFWRVILEHPENSLLLPRSWSTSSPTDFRMAKEIPRLFNLLSVGLPVLLLMGF